MAQDYIEVEGTILEKFPSAQYKVELENGREVLAYISGKMRIRHIKPMPGDRVRVKLSPYDLTRGRIFSIVWSAQDRGRIES